MTTEQMSGLIKSSNDNLKMQTKSHDFQSLTEPTCSTTISAVFNHFRRFSFEVTYFTFLILLQLLQMIWKQKSL